MKNRPTAPTDKVQDLSPVIVDGAVLFHVGGIETYPARRRAREIRERIIGLAQDPNFSVDSLTLKEEPQTRG